MYGFVLMEFEQLRMRNQFLIHEPLNTMLTTVFKLKTYEKESICSDSLETK